MSNALIKTANTTYVAGSPYVPASPGQPYIPAHLAINTVVVCSFQNTTIVLSSADVAALLSAQAIAWAKGTNTGALSANVGGLTAFTTGSWNCGPTQVTTTVPTQPYIAPTPATPGVASQVLTNYNLGWNSTAVSVASVTNDGSVAFDAPAAAIGILIGMVDASQPVAFASISHGLLFQHGVVQVYEYGVLSVSLSTTVATDRWLIRRALGVVTYLKNGTVVRTSALAPSYPSFALGAALYSGNDRVINPAIVAEYHGSAALSLRPLSVGGTIGFGTARHGNAAISLQPMTVSARTANRGTLSFLPLVLNASVGLRGNARLSLQTMSVQSSAGAPIPSYGVAALSMSYLTVGALGKTGGLLDGNLSMQPLTINASVGNRGNARLVMRPLLCGGSAYEGNNQASMQSTAYVAAAQNAVNNVLISITQNMTVAGVLTVTTNATASAQSLLTLSSTMSLLLQQLALMQSNITFSGTQPVFGLASSAWALNCDTQASSRYEQFNFNSMNTFDGGYFGTKADGVYQLEGADDAGTAIQSMVSFGKQTFKSMAKKRLSNAYIGVSSSGTMYLKVIADGVEYIYQSRRDGDGFSTAMRFDIGKGIRANYLEFELYNGTGADFDLASAEFVAVPTERRI
jgi:hypothetical protein